MTDELIKKADLYANNTHFTEYDNPSLSESLNISEEIKQAYIAGAKAMQKENEQLKARIEKLKEEKQYETCPYRSTDMGCDYCDYRDRDLKDEVEE